MGNRKEIIMNQQLTNEPRPIRTHIGDQGLLCSNIIYRTSFERHSTISVEQNFDVITDVHVKSANSYNSSDIRR
jgi:hypothetical protein